MPVSFTFDEAIAFTEMRQAILLWLGNALLKCLNHLFTINPSKREASSLKKKTLSQRVHQCECGVVAQRDLYSAFLAKYIEPDTFVLQVSQLKDDWQSAELRLQAAWRTATETKPATGRVIPSYERTLPRGRAGRCGSLN